MSFQRMRLVMAMAAGSLVVVPTVNPRLTQTVGTRFGGDGSAYYEKNVREFYMKADELGFIRPGFHVTVNSITIPEDRRPLVDYSFTDDFQQPLDRTGATTPGSLSINQVLAWWDADARHYTAYTTRAQTSPITGNSATQAAADSGGTWTDLEVGHSTYKFKTALPEGYDVTKTHTLAIYATRNTSDFIGKNYYDNVEHDFRPDGQDVTRDLGQDDQRRLQPVPRSPVRARRLAAGCQALRHLPPAADGRSGHGKHRRHESDGPQDPPRRDPAERRGGNARTSSSATTSRSTTSRTSSSRRTSATASAATRPRRRSRTSGTPSRPARPAASCHDNIDWVTGANHPAGPQADDTACATCHQPVGRPRIRRLDHRRAHGALQVDAAEGSQRRDRLGHRTPRPGQKPTVDLPASPRTTGRPCRPSAFTTESGGRAT